MILIEPAAQVRSSPELTSARSTVPGYGDRPTRPSIDHPAVSAIGSSTWALRRSVRQEVVVVDHAPTSDRLGEEAG